MVLAGHLDHGLADAGRLLQDLQAQVHVLLHGGELGLGELAGLVEDVVGHPHLADVVEHAAHARLQDGLLGQLHGAAEADEQGGDAHRVLEGVGVPRLDAHQAHQGAGVAEDGLGDLAHHGLHALRLDLLAQAHVLQHGVDDLVGLLGDLLGEDHLLLVGGAGGRGGRRGGHGAVEDLLLDDVLHLLLAGGLHVLLHVDALHRVDVHLGDAALGDAFQVRFLPEHEAVPEEIVVHPPAVQVVDEHSQAQVLLFHLLDHRPSVEACPIPI